MSIATEERLLTIADYLAMPDDGRSSELVRGRVVEMNPPSSSHGYYCGVVFGMIREFIRPNQLGRATINDSGVVTSRDPGTVRGADVAYYSYDRVPAGSLPVGYWRSPELVFEVLSPSDRWKDVLQKVAEYLQADVLTVAVVDPTTKKVHLFQAENEATILCETDTLEFPSILPGFSARVAELFE